jgi:hypothetical protein
MRIKKTLIAMLALAVAIALSPLPELQAATFVNPGTKIDSNSLIEHAQAKMTKKKAKKAKKGKKKAKRKRRGKKAKSRPGRCGAYMYWSRKQRKCVDARAKK